MKYPINYKDLNPTTEFYSEVIKQHSEAEQYLTGFAWCRKIIGSYLYTNMGAILCIFLFEIENQSSPEDSFLWIITGDIPPLYLDVFGPRTTVEVIEDYVNLAQDWIGHIKNGQSVDTCFPFNVNPTIELATLLEKKISFMKETLISNVEEITIKTPIRPL